MRTTWPQILRAEREKKTAEYQSLKDIFFVAGAIRREADR